MAWRWLNVPAARVLAAEPDRRALQQERPEGERLGEGPVDGAGLELLAAAVDDQPGQLFVDREVVGQPDDRLHHRRQRVAAGGRRDGVLGLDVGRRRDRLQVPALLRQLFGLLEGVVQDRLKVVQDRLGLLGRELSPRRSNSSRYSLRTVRWLPISSYISGCVYDGSSPSLWPYFL